MISFTRILQQTERLECGDQEISDRHRAIFQDILIHVYHGIDFFVKGIICTKVTRCPGVCWNEGQHAVGRSGMRKNGGKQVNLSSGKGVAQVGRHPIDEGPLLSLQIPHFILWGVSCGPIVK